MEFSENWLSEWLGMAIDDKFYDQITESGIEIERTKKVSKIFEKIVVGEVIECEYISIPHKIIFLRIKISKDKVIFVISSNNISFSCGMKLAIATKDSKLFDNKSIDFLKFLDKTSEGMVCSFEDLGMLNIKNSIIEISSEISVGIDLCEFLSFENDNIIKVSSTPNRADGISILGIARDILALNNFNLPILKKYHINVTIPDKFRILINIPDICIYFCGRIIKNVNLNKQTPIWILERLRRSSINSKNVVLDIVNYVLIELGQPIFAFSINDVLNPLLIRQAKLGESFYDEDRKEFFLDERAIVISDYEKILVLGNHVQSYHSKISCKDKNIFLGYSVFNSSLLCTDKNLSFDFGYRNQFTEYYERGVDPSIQLKTLNYITHLILKICGGDAGDITSTGLLENNFYRIKIILFKNTLFKYLKGAISSSLVKKYLLQLGYMVESKKECWIVFPPSWKFDIKVEEDIIGELIRIFGYYHLPALELLTSHNNVIDFNNTISYECLNRVKLFLTGLGYNEVITYGFVDPNIQRLLFSEKKMLLLSNPISKNMSSMRLSLWNGLLSSVLYNQNRQEKIMRFFESGLCFEEKSDEYLGVRQSLCLSGVVSGYKNDKHWRYDNQVFEFYDLKEDLELIIQSLGRVEAITFKKEVCSGLCSEQSAAIYLKQQKIGAIGVLDPIVSKKLDLKYTTILFELNWNRIKNVPEHRIENISEYPVSSRDISIIVDESISASDILKISRNVSLNEIFEVKIFDIFRGEKIGLGKKSITLNFVFGNTEKTLSENLISNLLNECISVLKLNFNAILRDKKYYLTKK